MPNNTSYWLPKDSKAWQQALDSVASLLPTDVSSTDHDALYSLPIFALIVVLPTQDSSTLVCNDILASMQAHVDGYIKSWVESQSGWQLLTVAEDNNAHYVNASVEGDDTHHTLISPVQVYRYLLIPTSATLMYPEKKTAAAHIIDDQLTTQLRQDLNALYQQMQQTQVNNSSDDNKNDNPDNRLDSSTHGSNDPTNTATDDTNTKTSMAAADSVAFDATTMVDCHVLSASHMLRTHKLVCFDMDSTLIEQEVIVELAKTAGIGDEVSAITESAMRGEINFDESFAKRVALLQGISTDVLDKICEQLTPSVGAHLTIAAFKALGYHTVLLSGGFVYFANYIAGQLGIDEVHANVLDIEDNQVTGKVQLPIVNGQKKAELVKQIAKRLDIDMTQVVCVGDGANDLPMLGLADLGIAYHAKPIVQARADAAINITGLDGVFYALGYPTITKAKP